MKFNSKNDWQEYIIKQIGKAIGGYAVVKYDNCTELLYFAKHSYEGEPWVLESPNVLRKYKIENQDDRKFYEEDGFLIKGDYAYDIDSPQCSPFLPDEIEVLEFIGNSEGKALDYMLHYQSL